MEIDHRAVHGDEIAGVAAGIAAGKAPFLPLAGDEARRAKRTRAASRASSSRAVVQFEAA